MSDTPMAYKALLFDLDGVLVNSVQLHYQAWASVAALYGVAFHESTMDHFRGLPREDCLKILLDSQPLTRQDIHHLLNHKDEAYQRAVRNTPAEELLMDGVREFLRTVREAGFALGIASSSVNAAFLCDFLGLTDLVDCVADGNTVENGKPAPDIFVWTAGALRTRPVECIAFEDGLVGIQAAKQAGMFVVGIGNGSWLAQADCHYNEIRSIQLEPLLEQASVHIEGVI